MNNYYTRVYDFLPFTTARSGQVDDELNALVAGLDLLPTDETALKRGTATWAIESGSGNSYIVTSGESRTSYQNGDHIAFLVTHVNTGPCTINIDGIGNANFVRADGADYEGGELLTNTIIEARYDNTNSRWQSTVLHVADGATAEIDAVIGSSTSLPSAPGLFDANLPWRNANDVEIASLGFNNDVDFSYINNVYGGDHIFQGYDGGGTIRTLLTLNPVSRSATAETLNATTAIQENGVNINTLYQPLDADLTAVADLTTDAYGLSLLETTSEANFKQLTNLEIGTDVQAYASNLDTLSNYGVLDEDDLLSDSDTDLATQQSIKAYVDAGIAAGVTAETVQDLMGSAIAGGVQTLISVTYDDPGNEFDFAVESNLSNYTIDAGFQESIEDIIGAMFSGNTETLIAATYQDGDGTIDLVVDNDLANYDNTNSGFAELSSANVFTGPQITVSNNAPEFRLSESDASADSGLWGILANNERLLFRLRNDALDSYSDFLIVERTGVTTDTINFINGTLQYGGSEVAIDSDIPTTEQIQDITGAMFSGNTETLITATYQDGDGTVDLVVEPNLSNYTIDAGFQESIEDLVGAMVSGNTETGIAVTYEDGDGTLDFILDTEFLQDLVGAMFSGNTEDGISATYQDGDGTIDLAVNADLTTDVTGILPEPNGGTGVNDLSSLTLDNFTTDLNGAELIFDADGDSSLHASTDDQIDVKLSNVDYGAFTAPITNFQSGGIQLFFHADGGVPSNEFNAASSIPEDTSQTVGPTGSGADNIWTALDSLPSTAKAIYVAIYFGGNSVGSGISSMDVYGSTSVANTSSDEYLARISIDADASNETFNAVQLVWMPVTSSQVFALLWAGVNVDTDQVRLYLKGYAT